MSGSVGFYRLCQLVQQAWLLDLVHFYDTSCAITSFHLVADAALPRVTSRAGHAATLLEFDEGKTLILSRHNF